MPHLSFRTLAVAGFAFASVAFAAVPLAENGTARADMIVATHATVEERSAAEELVRYLKQATGADWALRTQRERGRPAVLIGSSSASDAAPVGQGQAETCNRLRRAAFIALRRAE